ncbi:histidine kinase [Kineosporia rhizophila]|uniref:sensor histidine kinase n=1 Tax=Kineosporia rhizophila TaxID=84633 RepID=UPI001E4897A1|nr:histidine kinase [Kineosporia rhizophila]
MFIVLTVGLTLLCVITTAVVPEQTPYRPADVVALLLAAAGPLALLLARYPTRRTWGAPLALAGAGSVITVNAALGYTIGLLQWPPWIAVFLCFSTNGRWLRLASSALAGLSIAGFLLLDRGGVDMSTVSGIAMCCLIAAIGGEAARARRAHAVSLHEQELGRRREEALVAEGVLLTERNRLARELHDALGHSVNVMVLQAGVGRRVFGENPEFAQEALSSVETVGRRALVELDRMLRVLQPSGPGENVEEPAAPGLPDLTALVGQVRATGQEVHLTTGPEPELPLSAGSAQALYRIVQEALTNAVRHGSGAPIQVSVRHVGPDVTAEVHNRRSDEGAGRADRADRTPGAETGWRAGRGLTNMRERARMEGGRFEAGPVPGGFRVQVHLPVAGLGA